MGCVIGARVYVARVQDASEPAQTVGDAVIATFFAADKPKAREEERQKVESWITSAHQLPALLSRHKYRRYGFHF